MSTDWTDPRWDEYHVSPRYLAGSSYVGDAGFAPVQRLGWPHQLDDLGSYIVSSPDSRIQIGFFGDDYDLWRIAAYERPLAAPAWTAVFRSDSQTVRHGCRSNFRAYQSRSGDCSPVRT
jgi:hypothetical protein